MTYVLPNGRKMILAYTGVTEYAEQMRDTLVRLGCSEQYADAERDNILAAVKL